MRHNSRNPHDLQHKQAKLLLDRAKRIAAAFCKPPKLPCGCSLKGLFCGCQRPCGCAIDLELCYCYADMPDADREEYLNIVAEFLHRVDPENYAELPTPKRVRRCVSSKGRVATMQDRDDAGESLHHADDVRADDLQHGQECGFTRYAGAFVYGGVSEGWRSERAELEDPPTERDAEEFPLWFPPAKAKKVPFRARPAAVQRQDVDDDERRVARMVGRKHRQMREEESKLHRAARAALAAGEAQAASRMLQQAGRIAHELYIRRNGRAPERANQRKHKGDDDDEKGGVAGWKMATA